MSKDEPKILWCDGDPYVMDAEGEYVELHHSGQRD